MFNPARFKILEILEVKATNTEGILNNIENDQNEKLEVEDQDRGIHSYDWIKIRYIQTSKDWDKVTISSQEIARYANTAWVSAVFVTCTDKYEAPPQYHTFRNKVW